MKRITTPLFLLLLIMNLTSCQSNKTHTNDLIHETSPYLLQHANNPIDWQAWSDDLFDQAEEEDKLVVVSIGYSSCHWCHVMERETFEKEDVADVMNERFINVKVDREERPDVDQVYMTAVQLLTGSGGWPLNVILLPNGKPLYGGTYHTKEEWLRVTTSVDSLFQQDKKKAYEYAEDLTNGIQESSYIWGDVKEDDLTPTTIASGMTEWKQNWDKNWGGDKGAPKFMLPTTIHFLMDYASLYQDEEAEKHIRKTLDEMMRGGIYDQIQSGFFRYSTDENWGLPHFEKMLYDNAQLIELYAKAYRKYKDERYLKVVNEMTQFLQQEFKYEDGSYLSTLDAESEGVEGKYYFYTLKELQEVVTTEFGLFKEYYSVYDSQEIHLRQQTADSMFISEHQLSPGELAGYKKKWKQSLASHRQQRIKPGLDDKVITSWNALLVSGFVEAYKATGEQRYLSEAKTIIQQLETNNYDNQSLMHTYKEGSKKNEGFLDDYVFLAKAYLDLFEATTNQRYLEKSKTLVDQSLQDFKDADSPLYTYRKDDRLIAKSIPTNDNVIPSANAQLSILLNKLGHIYYNQSYLEQSKEMQKTVESLWSNQPSAYSLWSKSYLSSVFPYYEIVVVGDNAEQLIQDLNQDDIPNSIVIGSKEKSDIALFENRYNESKTMIFVCKNNTCKLPVETKEEAIEQLTNF